jgi:hypothetical protein
MQENKIKTGLEQEDMKRTFILLEAFMKKREWNRKLYRK